MPRLSLRAKMLSSFILILLPVFGLLVCGYREANERQIDTLLDTQEQTAQAVVSLMDAGLDEAFALAWTLTNDPVVQSLDRTQLDPHLQRLAPLFPQFEAFGVDDATGLTVGLSIQMPPGALRPNSGDRPAHKQLMATGQPVVSELIISRATRRPSMSLYVPLRDRNGSLIGHVGVAPYLDEFAKRIEGVTLGPEQAVLVADPAGTVAFYTALQQLSLEQRRLGDFEPIRAAREGRAIKVRQFVSPLVGDVRLGAFVRSPKYGLVVGVSMREDVALASVRAALANQLLGFGVVTLVSLGLALLLSSALHRPIRRLTADARALGRGDLGRRVRIKTGDEIEDLGRTFNQMAQEIQTREEQRERLLEEVQRRSAELNAAISASPDGMLIYDQAGNIMLMNPAAERLLGYTEEDQHLPLVRRMELVRLETTEGRPFPEEELPLRKALDGDTSSSVVAVLWPPRGKSLWVTLSSAPIRAPSGKILGAVLTFSDVTPIRELQQQRAKHVLAISHGLRTPLTVILGQAQLLIRALDRVGPNGPMRQGAERIEASSRRMSLILRDLVDLTSLENGQPLRLNHEALDLQSFATGLKESLAGVVDTSRIRVEGSEGLPWVSTDPDRLERVLLNLLSNALKYSDPGTEVVLRLTLQDREVVVSVKDQGEGIPEKTLVRLFEPYQREEERPENVGLGLHVAKGLVEAMGGRMWVESELGRGSTFSLTSPMVGTKGQAQ